MLRTDCSLNKCAKGSICVSVKDLGKCLGSSNAETKTYFLQEINGIVRTAVSVHFIDKIQSTAL